LITADAVARQMIGCDLGLLEERRHQTVSYAAMGNAFAHGVDSWVIGLQGVVDHNAPVAVNAGAFRQRGVGANAGGHHDQIGRNLQAVFKTDGGHPTVFVGQ